MVRSYNSTCKKQEQGGLNPTSTDVSGSTSGLTHMQVHPKDFNNIFREFQFLMKQAHVRGNLKNWAEPKMLK